MFPAPTVHTNAMGSGSYASTYIKKSTRMVDAQTLSDSSEVSVSTNVLILNSNCMGKAGNVLMDNTSREREREKERKREKRERERERE
jgi:hypothetical protein